MSKTTKSILKRFKITKSGKMMKSSSGINHFQAKKSRQSQIRKKRPTEMGRRRTIMIKSYLYR